MTICFATHISALLLISCQRVTKIIFVRQNTSAKIVPEKESVTLLIPHLTQQKKDRGSFSNDDLFL